uniref:Uncharacterized protein n=1 Tax=Caenorhabditis japonica TaxID=281687 RepID=A0A8R1DS06_CAEJA
MSQFKQKNRSPKLYLNLQLLLQLKYLLSCDARKNSVIVRNSEISPDATQDQILGEKIAKECGVSGKVLVFRISVKDKDLLIKTQLENKEEASKMLSTFEANKCKINECRSASVRPNLSKPELVKYRQAWKEAIRLNNEKKLRIFTVRDLEVAKIVYKEGQQPWPWTVRT